MLFRFKKRRIEFYQWRQRRPLKRAAALSILMFTWPIITGLRRFRRLVSAAGTTQRILVIHFGGLGDTLMLTPALAALKRHFPNAKLDIITLHEHVKNAFAHHPRVDSITALPAYEGRWINSRFVGRTGPRLIFATLRFYPELLLQFVGMRYDLGINFGLGDFDRRLGDALLRCLDARTRLASPAMSRADGTSVSRHRVDDYLDFLMTLGIHSADKTLEYPISDIDLDRAQSLLREHGVDQRRRLALIHPGGKLHINSRRWPAEYFARVCEFLFNEGFEVLLTGDADDATVCDQVARAAYGKATSLAGRLTLSESAALLSLADLAITNDTATLHLAEAAAVPRVVSIFGPTDPAVLAPRNARHIVFRSDLPCAPCMGGIIDANTARCWRDVREECLWQIRPDQVIGRLREIYVVPAARAASA